MPCQEHAEGKSNPNQTMLKRFSSNLWILQKIKQWGPSLAQPFPCGFHQLIFLPIFQLVGAQGWMLTEMPSTTPGFCWVWVYPGLVSKRAEVPGRLWLMTALMFQKLQPAWAVTFGAPFEAVFTLLCCLGRARCNAGTWSWKSHGCA